jgi:outer membrane receptor protein involved in Fe transport
VNIDVDAGRILLTPEGYTSTGRWFLGGGFLQAVWSPSRVLSLTLGARYDTFQGEAHPELTPRAGLVLKPLDALAIKLLYGHSYVAPMWAHKRANDGTFIGNPGLAPESFNGVDLIAAYGYQRLVASVDFFFNKVEGLINANPQPAPSTLMKYENTGESLYLGIDAAAEAQLYRWLRVQASYSYIQPAGGTSHTTAGLLVGDQIKDIPPHTLRYGVRLEPFQPINLGLSVWGRAYSATRTSDPVTMVDTIPAVALLDATLTYQWRRFALQVIGRNLTNRHYERGGTVGRPLARPRLDVEGALQIRF